MVVLPLALIVYQSLLDGPFFLGAPHFSLGSFAFILNDPDFWLSFWHSLYVATGMTLIAVPLGAFLAFLVVRTDIPGGRHVEVFLLLPLLISPIVLALGFVVAAGPVGFYSLWVKKLIGFVPWNIYGAASIIVIGGLTHVPHVYLYTSAALKNVGSDIEEAARSVGCGPLRVAWSISLRMVSPALLFSGFLVFLAGIELFGLVLVLGNHTNFETMSVYLFKLTNKLGTPSYQLMAAVAVCMVAVTFPLVALQRLLMRNASRYVSVKGKTTRPKLVPLKAWRWPALGLLTLWLFVTIFVPVSGIVMRAFVTRWGVGVDLFSVLTTQNFVRVFTEPSLVRAIVNSIVIGVVGGALAVCVYAVLALSIHRRNDSLTRLIDYVILVPRAVPGLLAGLAFLWLFLFVPPLRPLRSTLVSMWLAYTIVLFAYGTRLLTGALIQVGPDLEEAARSVGAKAGQVIRSVTLPLIRYGLLGSWVLVFLMFEREYATGYYLLTPGTELIGPTLITLADRGQMDLISALSVVNLVFVSCGLAVALRFGLRVHD